ncbi:MAG: hypothetical protein ABUL73_03325 [Alphaproteobacteria bacterium]
MTDGLFAADDSRPFVTIDPPFQLNATGVAVFAPEVTGYYLLQCLKRRLGWASFADKKLLDFGCGVRFARTIYNLDIPFGLYFGVDVNLDVILWLQANARDPRFTFAHLDTVNRCYNPKAGSADEGALEGLGVHACDAASMFSVITHQAPEEAQLTFRQLRRAIVDGGRLYFTAFIDHEIDDYVEAAPHEPGTKSTYNPSFLVALVEKAGWRVDAIHAQKATLQQPAFICTAI